MSDIFKNSWFTREPIHCGQLIILMRKKTVFHLLYWHGTELFSQIADLNLVIQKGTRKISRCRIMSWMCFRFWNSPEEQDVALCLIGECDCGASDPENGSWWWHGCQELEGFFITAYNFLRFENHGRGDVTKRAPQKIVLQKPNKKKKNVPFGHGVKRWDMTDFKF